MLKTRVRLPYTPPPHLLSSASIPLRVMKTEEVECASCGDSFEKKSTEVRRSNKLGRRHFCSRSCAGAKSPLTTDLEKYPPQGWPATAGRQRDEFSPFRHHLSRTRKRKHEVNITVEYLKQIWDEQEGKCPLTGWDMRLAETSAWDGVLATPNSASLDRIDSSKGYIVGNVRWICAMANYAKSVWTDEAVIEFAQAVVDTTTRSMVD